MKKENLKLYGEYDIMQDRDTDESYTKGIWDLARDMECEIKMSELTQEHLYNFLQDFKENIIANLEAKNV